jgi:FkbM family methyltransferase
MDPMSRFLSTHLSSGQRGFDVGANMGSYTRVMLDLVGPTGRVDAFEPNPELANSLSQWTLPNLHVHSVALSDVQLEAREFFLDIRQEMQGLASSLARLDDLHEAKQVQRIEVTSWRLDDFCISTDVYPHLVKIDTEGHELEVIRGASETIDKYRPILIFEFWETWWDRSVRRIFDFLRETYQLIRIQDGLIVNDHYYENQGSGVVDIACLPQGHEVRLQPDRLK